MTGIPIRPSFKILTDDQVDRIHEKSLAILEKTGVRFDSEDARIRLQKHGAVRHAERNNVMTFPRDVVEEAIRKVPPDLRYYARDPKWDVVYDGEHLFPYTSGGDPKIVDLETGQIRPSTLDDVKKAIIVADELDNNFMAGTLVLPNDVPAEMINIKTLEIALLTSKKTVSEYAQSAKVVEYMHRMCSLVSGGEEEFRKRPILSTSRSPSSPLTYARDVCDVLIRCCELGIPFSVVPCPISGATGPGTLAGALALQNAETLAGLVFMQAVEPRTQTMYCGRVCFMDPHSGRDLWGLPEEALASVAMIQLARKYHMVSDTCGMTSDIPRWDVQMGLERMMTILVPALAGPDSISGMGSAWEGASSLELMVIDNEIMNDVARVLRGIETDDSRFPLEVIDKVGHMGNFLAQRHTLEYIRKGEVRSSSLWDRRTTERAVREGFRSTQEEARERVRRILAERPPESVDKGLASSVGAVVKEASKALTGR